VRRELALTAETSINTAWYRVVAGSQIAVKGLKIRCPKGRAGSTPALGTNHFNNLQLIIFRLWTMRIGVNSVAHRILVRFLKQNRKTHQFILAPSREIAMTMTIEGIPITKGTRPVGITVLCIFFMAATAITLIASISLLCPGGFLEPIWQLNPRGRAGLGTVGVWAVVLLLVVGCACAVAAIGLWRGASWGYAVAIIVLSVNLLGDLVNAISGLEPRAAIGIPIVIGMLAYLMSQRVRRFFRP
jgi:hypothetical protein